MKLNYGVKVEYQGENIKVQDERTSLAADRHKTETDKGLDDLLFGSGAVRRRPQPPTTPTTQPVTQPVPVRPPPQEEKKPVARPEAVTTTTSQSGSKIGGGTGSSGNTNTGGSQSNSTGNQNSSGSKRQGYNRPSYIRKLKKIAENFDYQSVNQLNHSYYDIVRPSETDRSKVQLLQRLSSSQESFEDREFPATGVSVGRQYRNKNIEWKRASEFTNRAVFGKYVEPNDVEIGSLSSASFVSILSCLAERERNVKRIIENQEYNSNGFYYIRLNINSVWRYIAVDDFLPTLEGQSLGSLSFRDSESEISISLIEKAYAKAYNGYDVFTKAARPEDFLRDLTGSRIARYNLNDSSLMQELQFSLEQDWTVVAVPNSRIEELGLDSQYNLSLIKLGSRGFELRNSWGTTVERPKINFSKEGVFELSLEEAKKYFDYILVAQTDDRFITSTIQSKHQASFYSSYSFRIKSQAETIISASQWDRRLFPSHTNYRYAPFRIIVQRRISENKSEYVSGSYGHSRNLDLLVPLAPGEYSVYCIGSWEKGEAFDYNLTVFGNSSVQFTKHYTQNFPNLISNSLQQVNLENGKRAAKGHVDEYLLYHEPTNLVLLTNLNVSDKEYDYTQDLSRITFNSLSLLNGSNHDSQFNGKVSREVLALKNDYNQERRWEIHLQPKEAFTWVISTNEDYNLNSFKNWGFK